MSKHTPGPWVIERNSIGPTSKEDDQSYGMMMQVAYVERYDWPENACANARLISSAPDLLEALEGMVRKAQKQNWNDNYPAELSAAYAAIAKARGESK
jgi:hypothetical protein